MKVLLIADAGFVLSMGLWACWLSVHVGEPEAARLWDCQIFFKIKSLPCGLVHKRRNSVFKSEVPTFRAMSNERAGCTIVMYVQLGCIDF